MDLFDPGAEKLQVMVWYRLIFLLKGKLFFGLFQ